MYPLPYKSDQIENLLYKLSLSELLQVKDLTIIKTENIQRFIAVFVSRHPTISSIEYIDWLIVTSIESLYFSFLQLIERFFVERYRNDLIQIEEGDLNPNVFENYKNRYILILHIK